MIRQTAAEARQDMAGRFLAYDQHTRTCGTCASGGSCADGDAMAAGIDARAATYRDSTERWERRPDG
jgi:hypothetical protein